MTKCLGFWKIAGFQRTYIRLEDGVLFYLQYEDKEKKTVKSKRQWIGDEQKQK